MRKAERGFGSGRVVAALLASSLTIALAGCGGTSGSTSSGAASASSTPAVADTAPASTTTTGSGSTTGSSSTSGTTSGTTSGSATSSGSSGSTSGTSTASGTSTTGGTTATVASTSSVTLGWQPPTQNTNGSTITDLAGYKIHYGTASADYTQTVSVANAGLTRYVIDNLAKGTYYFAITAYNSQGVESAMSSEVSTTLN